MSISTANRPVAPVPGDDVPAATEPLLLGDVQTLRQKLHRAGPPLRKLWDHYQHQLDANEEDRLAMQYLDAVLTGDRLEQARIDLRSAWRKLTADESQRYAQFHSWVVCGESFRQIAYFDWLHHASPWSAELLEEAAEAYLGFGFRVVYPRLCGRGRSADNQVLSMTLYCLVAGYTFGYKLAQHDLGRMLYAYAIDRLPDILGLMSADGYGGEGSTYTTQVNTPLLCWAHQLLNQLGRHDLATQPLGPNGVTLPRLIEMELRILSPGGLQLPWDSYGWEEPINGAPLLYLADITRRPSILSVVQRFDMTSPPGALAWGSDNPMWSIVWWPGDQAEHDSTDLDPQLFGWMLPNTGAALDDVHHRSRLAQVWDRSAGMIAGIARAQMNPNHLIFEIDGQPVFQDGTPVRWGVHGRNDRASDRIRSFEKGSTATSPDPWQHDPEDVLRPLPPRERELLKAYLDSGDSHVHSLKNYCASISKGLMGGANAIVIDHEGWYWAPRPCIGKAEWYGRSDAVQAVCADSSDFYRDRYDVRRARRTSIWNNTFGLGVVLDDLHADHAHDWTWQSFLRPGVTLHDGGAIVPLPGRDGVRLAWAGDPAVNLKPMEGYPATQEARSELLQLTQRGNQVAFAVAMAATSASLQLRRLSPTEHELVADGRRHLIQWDPETGRLQWSTDGVCQTLQLEDYRAHEHQDIHRLSERGHDYAVSWPPVCQRVDRPSSLLTMDHALAQCQTDSPDSAALANLIRHGQWDQAGAAAEAAGRAGLRESIPWLIDRLNREHAIPPNELYPALDPQHTGLAFVKRWRLKVLLIAALGRLRAREAGDLIARILSDGWDFYPVLSVSVQALARIDADRYRDVLREAARHQESNTAERARDALSQPHDV